MLTTPYIGLLLVLTRYPIDFGVDRSKVKITEVKTSSVVSSFTDHWASQLPNTLDLPLFSIYLKFCGWDLCVCVCVFGGGAFFSDAFSNHESPKKR